MGGFNDMLSFLFEQYGYYPNNFIDGTFEVDGWIFKFIEVEKIELIDEIDKFIENIRNNFSNIGIYIIKSRNNEKITYYDGKPFVLMAVIKCKLKIEDLNKFHVLLKTMDDYVDLNKLCFLWEKKMNFIEQECTLLIKNDSACYKENLECIMFSLGLCQNAVQYLKDTAMDYDNIVSELTISHKRLSSLEACEVFNPFNFVVDHPLRDYVELYKNDVIDLETMIKCLEYYDISPKLASVIVARLLYPSVVFDCLENNYYDCKKKEKIDYNIEKEILKIKNVYMYFKKKYQLRPILWLDNN